MATVAAGCLMRHSDTVIKLQVFKPLDHRTASVELWQDDVLLAEVFADGSGIRRLYIAGDSTAVGLDWRALTDLAPRITALLDKADDEMRRVREDLGEP